MATAVDVEPESDALQAYLRAIAKIPRLSADEERELAWRVQRTGDEDALRVSTHALSLQTRAISLPQKRSGTAARSGREVAELTEQLERATRSASSI